MKKFALIFSAISTVISIEISAQSTSISDVPHSADNSAVLDVHSTSKGVLIPRMTETQRQGIATPATGLLVYQTDLAEGFYYYDGIEWTSIATGVGSQWDTNSTSLYYDLKNVGIGTDIATAPLNVEATGSTSGEVVVAIFEGTSNTGSSSNYVQTRITNNSTSNSKTALIMGGKSNRMWGLGTDANSNNGQNFWIFDFDNFRIPFYISQTGFVSIGNTQISPNSNLHVEGSLSLPIATKTSTYTATFLDHTILCNAGTMTVNLPTAVGITGRVYLIKKISATAGTVTIDPNGTETVDGATTNTELDAQWESITIQSDGFNWVITSRN